MCICVGILSFLEIDFVDQWLQDYSIKEEKLYLFMNNSLYLNCKGMEMKKYCNKSYYWYMILNAVSSLKDNSK